jgi:hypothetical protein
LSRAKKAYGFFSLEVLPAAKLHYCLETAASMPPVLQFTKIAARRHGAALTAILRLWHLFTHVR